MITFNLWSLVRRGRGMTQSLLAEVSRTPSLSKVRIVSSTYIPIRGASDLLM